jgi:hypothetical protein
MFPLGTPKPASTSTRSVGLHKYLYGGWSLASELKLKPFGSRILVYLTFMKVYLILHDKRNVIAIDVNENNVMVAIFRNYVLVELVEIKSGLGRIVIAYDVRRKRVTRGRSTKIREVKKSSESLERKKEV